MPLRPSLEEVPDRRAPCNVSIRERNVLNLRLNTILKKANISIMNVWETSVAFGGADHCGIWRFGGETTRDYDCHHFCEPSSSLELQVDFLVAYFADLAV